MVKCMSNNGDWLLLNIYENGPRHLWSLAVAVAEEPCRIKLGNHLGKCAKYTRSYFACVFLAYRDRN